jgi:transposase
MVIRFSKCFDCFCQVIDIRADERNQALGMLRAGMSTRNVANNFNCNHSKIVRLRQRFLATNTVADRPRPGAPRVTTQAQDQMVRLQHLRERFRTATVTARETVWTL